MSLEAALRVPSRRAGSPSNISTISLNRPATRSVCCWDSAAPISVDFVIAPTFVWSSPFVIGSTPWSFFFTAQYPACPCPCLRFASSLSTDGARLGVRMDHYSFPARLFHSQHHAGLSRRTTKPFLSATPTPAPAALAPEWKPSQRS